VKQPLKLIAWSRTGSMHSTRDSHTATVLNNGEVLVTDGEGYWNNVTRSC